MISAVSILKNGGVGILPTDTLYGLVGSALRPEAVARIYELKKRDLRKPLIVLIAEEKDLAAFCARQVGGRQNAASSEFLKKVWPGPVSVLLPCADQKFEYLHRGTGEIAFRVPAPVSLRKFLAETGPLVAPSANPEGLPPAKNIAEARAYFDDKADFYEDGGELSGAPSSLLRFNNGKIETLR